MKFYSASLLLTTVLTPLAFGDAGPGENSTIKSRENPSATIESPRPNEKKNIKEANKPMETTDIYRPSEEISEDLSVSFPVDI